MNQKDLQKTRRERIAYFFSMDGAYRWIVLGPACATVAATFLLALPARIAIRTEGCTPKPEPALGNTYYVPYHRNCLMGAGYVNPKTEHFIYYAAMVTFGLFGLCILLASIGVLGRKIFGDPRYPPDLRQGFQPMDEAD